MSAARAVANPAATVAPRPSVCHILATYRAASDQQVADGHAWYQRAHHLAAGLDPRCPRRAAGVLAALSPRTGWDRNVQLARRAYVDGCVFGALGRSCRAAEAILAGAEPLEVLHGPKVRAFYRLIADPDDAVTVCVDRHGVDVAVGRRLVEAQRSAWFPLDRRGLYEAFAGCYRAAAGRVGVSPGQVQSVTWLVWRATWSAGHRPA